MENSNHLLSKEIIVELEKLPTTAIQEVLDFIGYLQTKYPLDKTPRGSAKALLTCWGKGSFPQQEQEALDAYIQKMRELPDDRLFT